MQLIKGTLIPIGGNEDKGINSELEKAERVADYIELASVMTYDALKRNESCGAHFRSEYQTEDGEAMRNDEEYQYVSVWEFEGQGIEPKLHKEKLEFEINGNVKTQVDKKNGYVFVFPSFDLNVYKPGKSPEESEVSIKATFEIIYKAKELKSLTKKNFDAFGQTNGVYNAWPYWREFVQNTIARMGLPPLTIPVFRLVDTKPKKKKV